MHSYQTRSSLRSGAESVPPYWEVPEEEEMLASPSDWELPEDGIRPLPHFRTQFLVVGHKGAQSLVLGKSGKRIECWRFHGCSQGCWKRRNFPPFCRKSEPRITSP